MFLIEQHFVKKGGPPRHMHPTQDEWFYVMEGEFVFEIGEPGKATRFTMKPGDSALAPRGLAHVFSRVSEEVGRMLVGFTPAERVEAFFRKISVEGAPVPLTKELLEEYGMVFVGPPVARVKDGLIGHTISVTFCSVKSSVLKLSEFPMGGPSSLWCRAGR